MLRAGANEETFVSATMCPQQCVLVCQGLTALVNDFPEGRGDPGLMWQNTGTLWGLCNKFLPLWCGSGGKCGDFECPTLRFCSNERRLGTIDCSLDRKMAEEKKV